MMVPPVAPLAWMSFRLARAFGWTPQQVQALTLGQVLLYLTFLEEEADGYSR